MRYSFLVKNISCPYTEPEHSALEKAKKLWMHSLGRLGEICNASVFRRSVDARKKDRILFVYSVCITAECGAGTGLTDALRKCPDINLLALSQPQIGRGSERLKYRPVIVGFGPCGMFAALVLAKAGYRPIVLERGDDVEQRAAAVRRFLSTRELDTESNIQFGAGGAGTFSDGKLVTRINDGLTHYVLQTFAALGAGEEILTCARPHIGTDVLLRVVASARDLLQSLGATFHFRCKLTGIRPMPDGVALQTTHGEIPAGAVILAVGHSARDTYQMLAERGYDMLPKPFSVGVRIEHLQLDIEQAMYGEHAMDPRLPRAEYHLSHRCAQRGVYSFCMCPGGEVVAAASETGGVVVNGMSNAARSGKNANAALAVSVLPEDYGGTFAGAIALQRRLEQQAFVAGGKTYAAPVQTVGDFLSREVLCSPSRVQPTYMNGFVRLAPLHELLPPFVTEMLDMGIRQFERKIHAFSAPDALLTGVETRTSAPVRILRADTYTAVACDRVYPAGEGAGYAGGITSAAIDGIHCATALAARFSPCEAQ